MYPIPMVDKLMLQIEKTKVDDFVDRAHYMLTVVGLLFAMLLIGAKQIFGDPIRCQSPAHYNSAWMSYVNEYCFVTGTFALKDGKPLSESDPADLSSFIDINYYQWVPYVLLGQALFFYLPHFVWNCVRDNADIDLRSVVVQCAKARSEINAEKRSKAIQEVAGYVKKSVRARRKPELLQDGLGGSATLYYLGSKVAALVNVLLQFYLLNATVGQGSAFWGFKVVVDSLHGIYWDRTGFFPRVTYCISYLEDLANTNSKATPCVLMVNMLNEKVFAIVYFWFLTLLVMSLANLIYCAVHFACLRLRIERVYDYLGQLHLFAPKSHVDDSCVRKFIVEKLGLDGFLLLYFIEGHAGWATTSEVTCQLYKEIYDPDEPSASKTSGKGDAEKGAPGQQQMGGTERDAPEHWEATRQLLGRGGQKTLEDRQAHQKSEDHASDHTGKSVAISEESSDGPSVGPEDEQYA